MISLLLWMNKTLKACLLLLNLNSLINLKDLVPKKKFLIFPEESDWNFTNLSCFINELDSFTKKKVIIELMNPN